MKPGKLDLPVIWRGCDWGPVTLTWKNRSGNPISLSGWHPKAHSLNIDLNAQITDEDGGETVLSLTSEQTASLKLGVESWDWIWERGRRFTPFLSGKVQIKQPVTNGV